MAKGMRDYCWCSGSQIQGRTQPAPPHFLLLPNHKNENHGQRGAEGGLGGEVPRTWPNIEGQGDAEVVKSKVSMSIYLLHLLWVLSSSFYPLF